MHFFINQINNSFLKIAALTVGTDGEGDHNIEETIRESHFRLEELERESNAIEQKFQRFRSTLLNK